MPPVYTVVLDADARGAETGYSGCEPGHTHGESCRARNQRYTRLSTCMYMMLAANEQRLKTDRRTVAERAEHCRGDTDERESVLLASDVKRACDGVHVVAESFCVSRTT